MNIRSISVTAVTLLSGLAMAGHAFAQTDADTFDVSITVENSCLISVTNLGFGTVDTLAANIDAATTGSVTCTGVGPLNISFNAGTGTGSTLATRTMEDGASNTIDYNLFRDSGRTEILGDGTGGTFEIAFNSTGGADAFDVFGRVAGGQNPKPVGTYSSTVTATVAF
jgi:spore coat protein U-like protein